jgi:hypothetical protein
MAETIHKLRHDTPCYYNHTSPYSSASEKHLCFLGDSLGYSYSESGADHKITWDNDIILFDGGKNAKLTQANLKLSDNHIYTSTDNEVKIVDVADTIVNLNSAQTLANKTINGCIGQSIFQNAAASTAIDFTNNRICINSSLQAGYGLVLDNTNIKFNTPADDFQFQIYGTKTSIIKNFGYDATGFSYSIFLGSNIGQKNIGPVYGYLPRIEVLAANTNNKFHIHPVVKSALSIDGDYALEADVKTSSFTIFNDKVGINQTSPTESLEIVGNMKSDAVLNTNITYKITTINTTPTTLNSTHSIANIDASGQNIVINLPQVSTILGKNYIITKIDSSANTVTINTYDANDKFDFTSTSIILSTQGEKICIIANVNQNWLTV